jgi:predicted NACHT family NTPase
LLFIPSFSNAENSTRSPTEISPLTALVQQLRSHQSENIQKNYGKIRLLNRKQIDVDRLYVDVYILERLSSSRSNSMSNMLSAFDVERDRLAMGFRLKRSPGFQVANEQERLMVLGKPGSGKSTFLRHLAIACCKGDFQSDRIPVLIELRSISDFSQFDLVKLIQEEIDLLDEAQVQKLLKVGSLLLLLDGLDEVSDQFRFVVQRNIQLFCNKHFKNRVVLSCRTQTVEHLPPNFDCVEIADFNPEQVDQFAHNWFSALSETLEQGVAQAADFIGKLKRAEHQQTAELAITPVLLSLACWVFQDQGDFPQERSDLYRRGVELLLKTWDGDRGIQREFNSPIYKKLSIEDKQNLLGAIAIRKFQQDQFALFAQQEIQKYIADHLKISQTDGRAVLKSIEAQHGLLVERASEIYSFSHLTFQEYFAARWLCDAGHWQSVKSDVTQKRWKEVLSIAFTLSNADRLTQAVKSEIDQMLAADPKLQQFLIWLSEKERLIEVPYRRFAIRAFYFAIALDLDLDLARDLARDLALTLDLALDRALDRDLDLTLDLALDLDLDLDLDLNRALTRDLDLARDPKLQPKLQELFDQLLGQFSANQDNFYRWWQAHGEAWRQQLRAVMIEHRNIGHDWQFTEEQKQKLQQYYDVNKLLVYCLQQEQSKVSPEVRQAIEDSLLLPVRSDD